MTIPLTNGLRLHLPLNGASGGFTPDLAPGGRERRVVGSETFREHSDFGATLLLNRKEDGVQLGAAPELAIAGNQTIAMWLRPGELGARRTPFSKAYGGSGTIIQEADGELSYCFGTHGGHGEPWFTLRAGRRLRAGRWAHICLVRDFTAGEVRWYVNGVCVSVHSAPVSEAATGDRPAFVGRGRVSGGEWTHYKGQIAHVRVYQRALDAAEVELVRRYDRGLAPPGPTPPALYLPLDRVVDGAVEDRAPGGGWFDLLGEPRVRPHPQFGQTLLFNKKDQGLNLRDLAALRIQGDQTIAMWLRPTKLGVRRNPYSRAFGGTGTITQEADGTLSYRYGPHGRNAAPSCKISTRVPLVEGDWTHACVVRDLESGRLRWFLNGEQVASRDAPYPIAGFNGVWAYVARGFVAEDTWRHYNGEIAHLRVYARALAVDEVRQVMHRDRTGLRVHLPMDAEQDGFVFDSSLSGARGWLGPGVAVVDDPRFGRCVELPGTWAGTIALPPSVMPTGEQLSICFWARGDSDRLPSENEIVWATSAAGHRTVCIHLPWSDDRVIFDAGGADERYDRCARVAELAEVAGDWVYWAFVKDGRAGALRIYRDGLLWQESSDSNCVLTPSTHFAIGRRYPGRVAKLQVYERALTETRIRSQFAADGGLLAPPDEGGARTEPDEAVSPPGDSSDDRRTTEALPDDQAADDPAPQPRPASDDDARTQGPAATPAPTQQASDAPAWVVDGALLLDTADLPSTPARALLTTWFGGQLALEQVTVVATSGDDVQLSGRLRSTVLGMSNRSVSVWLRPREGQVEHLRLELADLPLGWSLTDAFPALSGELLGQFTWAGVALTFDSAQVAADLAELIDAPERPLVPGLWLQATVGFGATGLAEVYTQPVVVSGPVTLDAGLVALLLTGAPQPASLPLLELELALTLAARAERSEDSDEPYQLAWAELSGDLHGRGGHAAIPVVASFDDTRLPVGFVSHLDQAVSAPLPALLGDFVDSDQLSGTLAAVPWPEALALKRISVLLNLRERSLREAWFELEIQEDWVLAEGLLTVSNPGVSVGVVQRESGDRHVGFTLFGAVRLLDAHLHLLGKGDSSGHAALTLSLAEDSQLTLSALCDHLDIPAPSSSALALSQLNVVAELPDGTISFFAGVEGVASVDVGGVKLSLEQVEVSLHLAASKRAAVSSVVRLGTVGLGVRGTWATGRGWRLAGGVAEPISLRQLVAELAQAGDAQLNPARVPDVTLERLWLEADLEGDDLQLDATVQGNVDVPFGATELSVSCSVSLRVSTDLETDRRTVAVAFTGSADLGHSIVEVQLRIDRAGSFVSASWNADAGLALPDTLSALGLDSTPGSQLALKRPLRISSIALSFHVETRALSFSASAVDLGAVAFRARKGLDGWSFALGVGLGDGVGLAGLMDGGERLSGVQLEAACLVVSNRRWPDLTLPGLALFEQGPMDAIAGVMVVALVDLDRSSGEDVARLRDNVEASGTLRFRGALGPDEAWLETSLSGAVTLGQGDRAVELSNAALRLLLRPEPGIAFLGSFRMTLQEQTATAQAQLRASTEALSGAFFLEAEGQGLKLPFAPGVRLVNIGGLIELQYSPFALGLAVQGSFTIPALDQVPGDNEFAMAIAIIEKVPYPELIYFRLAELSLSALVAAFADRVVDLPTPLDAFSVSHLLVYWCAPLSPGGVLLPDGTYAKAGTRLRGLVSIASWDAWVDIEVGDSTGIRADIQLEPIEVRVNAFLLFGLTGDGIDRPLLHPETNDIITHLEGGGAVGRIDTEDPPYLWFSCQATLFGLTRSVLVRVDDDGLHLEFELGVLDVASLLFVITVGAQGFGASATLAFRLEMDLPLGRIVDRLNTGLEAIDFRDIIPDIPDPQEDVLHLDVGFEGSVEIQVGAEGFMMAVKGGFVFEGEHVVLPGFELEILPDGGLDDLPALIRQHVRDNAGELFHFLRDEWSELVEDTKEFVLSAAAEVEEFGLQVFEGTQQAAQAIEDGGMAIYEDLTAFGDRLTDEARETAAVITDGAQEVLEQARDTAMQIRDGAEAAALMLGGHVEHAARQIEQVAEQFAEQTRALLDDISAEAREIVDSVAQWGQDTVEAIEEGARLAIEEIREFGRLAVETVHAGLVELREQLRLMVQRVRELAEAVGLWFTEFSAEMFGVLVRVKGGAMVFMGKVVDFGEDFARDFNRALKRLIRRLEDFGEDLEGVFTEDVSEFFTEDVREAITEEMINAFRDFGRRLRALSKNNRELREARREAR